MSGERCPVLFILRFSTRTDTPTPFPPSVETAIMSLARQTLPTSTHKIQVFNEKKKKTVIAKRISRENQSRKIMTRERERGGGGVNICRCPHHQEYLCMISSCWKIKISSGLGEFICYIFNSYVPGNTLTSSSSIYFCFFGIIVRSMVCISS